MVLDGQCSINVSLSLTSAEEEKIRGKYLSNTENE